MARLLSSSDGLYLIEWLEAKYVQRRTMEMQPSAAGTMPRVVRTTLAGSDPYETYRRIGHMDMINELKDLQEYREG